MGVRIAEPSRAGGGQCKTDCRAALDSTEVAPLVRLLHTFKSGFTRRQVAFGDCGKSCGWLRHLVAAFDVTTKNSKRREFS
jgi:hypothetical protein